MQINGENDTSKKEKRRGFAKRLVLRRKELGYTQPDVARLMKVSLNTIQNYEAGALPKGDYAIILAEALQCSLDWLFLGPSETEPIQYKTQDDIERQVMDVKKDYVALQKKCDDMEARMEAMEKKDIEKHPEKKVM